MLQSLKSGIGGLARFKGRDRRGRFWPYALVVIALAFAGLAVVMLPEMNASFERMSNNVAENPDKGSVTYSTSGVSVSVEGNHPELMPNFGKMFGGMAVVIGGVVVLRAAAVTRRLHDVGRAGFWGLPPLILLSSAFVVFPWAMEAMGPGDNPDLRPFLIALANNMLYLAALGLLIVFLVMPGKVEANRYGPPSV